MHGYHINGEMNAGEKIQPGLKVNLIHNTGGFFGAEAEKDPQGFLCRDVFGDINENKSIRVMVDFQEIMIYRKIHRKIK